MASKAMQFATRSLTFCGNLNNTRCNVLNQALKFHQQNGFIVPCQRLQTRSLSTEIPSTDEEITIQYESGLPVVSVPLPSRAERCRFVLKPISNTVGDLVNFIKEEDKGVDHVAAYHEDGLRIAKSTPIEALLRSNFKMVLNNRSFSVVTPDVASDFYSSEHATALSDVKNSIMHLYSALNLEEHQMNRERDLQARLEKIRSALEPYENLKQVLADKSAKRTSTLQWLGLGAMGLQFGVLARLTWWEYSWDIMEPVTYFVTYGTSMAMFAYYVCTKQDYSFPAVFDREYLLHMHDLAKKHNLDIEQYNKLKDQLALTEHDLKRLRDPLQLQLPIAHLARQIPGEQKNGTSPVKPETQ